MRLGCVVMACGAGRRFAAAGGAGNKLLTPVAGVPLVVRTVASVPADVFEVVVTTCWPEVAHALERALPGAQVAPVAEDDRSRRASACAGLSRGLERWDGCLFLPGDQPLVTRASFTRLARAFADDPARAYRLAWAGEPASPVLFPRESFAGFWSVPGSDGGRTVLRALGVPVTALEATDASELLDVDTPDAVRAVEAALAARGEDGAST